jgi:hypothetical protein
MKEEQVDKKDLDRKFQQLFDESEIPNRMDNIDKTLRNMDPEEEAEVRDFLAGMMGKKEAKKPKFKWLWSFKGAILFKAILFVVEFLILNAVLFFLLPISINTTVTMTQIFCGSVLLTFLRQWWSK